MPTIMEAAGLAVPDELPGRSLLPLCRGESDSSRIAFSEYHAQGMLNAGYMLKKGSCKYNHYVGYEPQLFDTETDPEEVKDLAADPAHRRVQLVEVLGAQFDQPQVPEAGLDVRGGDL